MKKTKWFIIVTALIAVISVGNANAAPMNHHPHSVQVVHTHTAPRHHEPHHHHVVVNHHHHHHHHDTAGNIILATAILVSALM